MLVMVILRDLPERDVFSKVSLIGISEGPRGEQKNTYSHIL